MKPDSAKTDKLISDYIDGVLSPEDEKLLMELIGSDPELIDALGPLAPSSEIPGFTGKIHLKRKVTDLPHNQFELLCAASVDGAVTPEQESELQEIIEKDIRLKSEYNLFQKTKLTPIVTVFKGKKKLYRQSQTVLISKIAGIVSGIAAAVFIAILFFNNEPSENIETSLLINQGAAPSVTSGNVNKSVQQTVKTEVILADNQQPVSKGHVPVTAIIATAGSSSTTDTSTVRVQNPFISKTPYLAPPQFAVNPEGYALASISISEPTDLSRAKENRTLNTMLAMFVRKKVLGEEKPAEGTLKTYELADAGITGINKLLGWEMSLKKNYNDAGDVKSVYFNSKLIRFTAPVKKDETAE
jgi:K+-transporting ATPase c subunit